MKRKRAAPQEFPPVDTPVFKAATAGLSMLHPEVTQRNEEILASCGAGSTMILDSVISTLLSQNTTEKNSREAFGTLKENYPTWTAVLNADDAEVEDCIRVAGLAKTRTARLKAILKVLSEKASGGPPSFEYLRSMSTADCKEELSKFKGLGPKTISCVLLFGLGREEFPVDTHVLRISKMEGWVPDFATRETAYEFLNTTVPNELKMDLHCLLVTHGKVCKRCAANNKPQFPPEKPFICPFAKISRDAKSKEGSVSGDVKDEKFAEVIKEVKVEESVKVEQDTTVVQNEKVEQGAHVQPNVGIEEHIVKVEA